MRGLVIATATVAGIITAPAVAVAQTATSQAPPAAGAPPLPAQPKDFVPPFRGPFGFAQMPTGPSDNLPPNTMSQGLSSEAKLNAFRSMMMVNPLSLRQMMSIMVAKKKAESGISFDEVVDSMKLKANKLNFKLVGHNALYKDIIAIAGKQDTPRVEIFSFCDAIVARNILDHVPEFIAFLPCRIAVLEDARKEIWLVTLDWDVRWLDTSNHPDKIATALRADAIRIREAIEEIMVAGAKGEL